MQKGHALLLPVSGLLGRVTRDLYEKCANGGLQKAFPHLKVACIGTPFPKTPHPLEKKARHLLSRNPEETVARSWAPMIGFGINEVIPALPKNHVVVSLRFGLDIPLFAAASPKWDVQGGRAMAIHHAMVRRVMLGELKMRVPDAYILPDANGEDERMLLETFPELRELSAGVLHGFIEKQRTVIEQYFDPATGQNEPLRVDATRSVDEMFDAVVAFIERRIHLYP